MSRTHDAAVQNALLAAAVAGSSTITLAFAHVIQNPLLAWFGEIGFVAGACTTLGWTAVAAWRNR